MAADQLIVTLRYLDIETDRTFAATGVSLVAWLS
jgi:hypothetical protein